MTLLPDQTDQTTAMVRNMTARELVDLTQRLPADSPLAAIAHELAYRVDLALSVPEARDVR